MRIETFAAVLLLGGGTLVAMPIAAALAVYDVIVLGTQQLVERIKGSEDG